MIMKRKVLASVMSLSFFIVLFGCKKEGESAVIPPPPPPPGGSITKHTIQTDFVKENKLPVLKVTSGK